jgi:hypothetical protein
MADVPLETPVEITRFLWSPYPRPMPGGSNYVKPRLKPQTSGHFSARWVPLAGETGPGKGNG